MGIINFTPSKEVPKPSWAAVNGTFKKVYTSNWRFLEKDIKEKTIIIINHNFQIFKIYNITLQEFHDNNEANGKIKKPFIYLRNCLSCYFCHGTGYVDWIQKVMGVNRNSLYIVVKYNRDSNHITSLKSQATHKLYGSIPKLQDGDEICPVCGGCGVYAHDMLGSYI